VICLRPLTSTLLELSLTLAYTEAAQPFKVLGGVVPPTARSASGKWKCAEPLADSEPTYADAEGVSTFGD
jgi:hypothetical protein